MISGPCLLVVNHLVIRVNLQRLMMPHGLFLVQG
uniref:Apt1 n=1 Tax=Arundo donax TaxID=35708 RepID=A0A0A9FXP6_ARUDO